MGSSSIVDLNCDLGESFGRYTLGADEQMMALVTSVNVACGFHAGDPSTIHHTVRLAAKAGVAIGAHPGFPDLQGFGRREMSLSDAELHDAVLYQIGALEGFMRLYGATLHHVKPHGALYNMAAKNMGMARTIAEAVYRFNPDLIFYGQAGSAMVTAAEQVGLRVYAEAFVDRRYTEDGHLAPRSALGAVVHDPTFAAEHAVDIASHHRARTLSGGWVPVDAHTLCLHGDTANAVSIATAVTAELRASGVRLSADVHRQQ